MTIYYSVFWVGDVSKSLRSTSGSTLSARRICIR